MMFKMKFIWDRTTKESQGNNNGILINQLAKYITGGYEQLKTIPDIDKYLYKRINIDTLLEDYTDCYRYSILRKISADKKLSIQETRVVLHALKYLIGEYEYEECINNKMKEGIK